MLMTKTISKTGTVATETIYKLNYSVVKIRIEMLHPSDTQSTNKFKTICLDFLINNTKCAAGIKLENTIKLIKGTVITKP